MSSFQNIVDECRSTGYTVISLSGNQAEDLPRLEELLRRLGEPIRVFKQHPFWKPLAADLDRPPGRSGGVGLNSLHADCVNAQRPPDYLCLYCVRPDPLGGGKTILASLDNVEEHLTTATINALSRAVYRDGAVYDLDHVGIDVNPFPVYGENGWRWRYTGRLLEAGGVPPDSNEYAALLEFDRIMMSRAMAIMLKAGQAAIIDQRRILHGRLPLAPGQDALHLQDRRLLVQAYCKDKAA